MTAEEWKKVEKTLSVPYFSVKMTIDGYNISIITVEYKPLRYCYEIFVDGKFKLKWLTEDCEIRRRFCCRRTKSLLSAKQKKELKRERKKIREYVEKEMTYEWYEPFWTSFRSLKNHLIKNNTSIELVEDRS